MVSQHSKNHTFLTGKESSYAVAVTAEKDWGLIQSVTPTDKRELSKNYSTGSREVQDITMGKLDVGLDIELQLQHGRPFEYLLGSVTHSSSGADNKHEFDIATTIPSFTAESSFNSTTDSFFQYKGCKLNEGTVSVDKGGILTLSTNAIASSVEDKTASGASTAVISDIKPLHFKNASLKTGTAGSETSPGCVQKFDITFNNDLEGVECAGNIEIQEAVEKNLEITYTFDMTFQDTTEYQRFLGGTNTTAQTSPSSFSTVFDVNNGVDYGSGRREFYCQLTGCNYEEIGTPVNVGDLVIQSFKGVSTGLGSDKLYYIDSVASGSTFS